MAAKKTPRKKKVDRRKKATRSPLARPTRILCPGCHKQQLPKDFRPGPGEPRDTPEIMCRTCRADGRMEDATLHLSVQERAVLKGMLQGLRPQDIADRVGMDVDAVREITAGQKQSQVRRAMQFILEREGLDLFTIGRELVGLLKAESPKWNKANEEWDFFPDNATKMQVLRHATRLLEADPPPAMKDTTTGVTVVIQTNLDDEAQDERLINEDIEADFEVVASV